MKKDTVMMAVPIIVTLADVSEQAKDLVENQTAPICVAINIPGLKFF